MKIKKMGEEWILNDKFLVEMINFIYEQCEIDKKKEVVVKIVTGEHISIKISKERENLIKTTKESNKLLESFDIKNKQEIPEEKSIDVKVIFLNEERDVTISEEELLGEFKDYLEIASESRVVDFNYYCGLRKLFEEGEIGIKLKCKKEKYIYDLDKKKKKKSKEV